jgi:hypothetical protein
MIPIYLHEYTFTMMKPNKMGIQQVVVTIVTESKEKNDFDVSVQAEALFEGDLNVSHKILLEGYKKNV